MAPNDFLVARHPGGRRSSSSTPFLGRYIHRVMEGERVFLSPIVRPVERPIYRVCGIDETAEQGWKGYAVSVLVMAFVAIVAGYVVLRLQDVLPLNQASIPAMSPDLAFNTSVSFETNTNWQNYSGETGATYLTQAAMLAVRNFTSAATGLADRDRPVPRAHPAQLQDDRQLLGRPDPRRPVHPAADRPRRRPRPRLAGRAPDVEHAPDHHHAPGRAADHRLRADRLAGVHQGAGQQRRRLPQRQLRPSVREPDPADELARDVRHPAAAVRADLHVRAVRRQPAPGLDDLRGHGGGPARRLGRGDEPRVPRQPALPDDRRPGPRQHGGQGDPVRVRPRRPVRGGRRPARAPARSTPGTTAPSRSPGSSRSSTWSSARSRRAGSAPGCTGCSSSARSWRCSSPA